jgi:hypothetical protein
MGLRDTTGPRCRPHGRSPRENEPPGGVASEITRSWHASPLLCGSVAHPAFRLTTAQSLSCQFWRRRDGAELTDRRRDGMRAPWRIGASRADHETRLLRWMEHLIFISDSPTLHTST